MRKRRKDASDLDLKHGEALPEQPMKSHKYRDKRESLTWRNSNDWKNLAGK
jgi:hypothetical protein